MDTGKPVTREPDAAPVQPAMPALTPARFALAVARCVRFYSRLPMPAIPGEADPHAIPDFRIEPVGLPVAAMIIALPAVLVTALAFAVRLDPVLVAALAITALVITTGAFHEDGLGDSADGLFGGHDPERRLEIMKDSRIGTFAGCALVLSLLLRSCGPAGSMQPSVPCCSLPSPLASRVCACSPACRWRGPMVHQQRWENPRCAWQ
jgi:adenosylcobinamide-GDP ribazoletransferase